MKLNKDQIKLREIILDISYKKHLSHLGSCLTAVDIIESIYQIKQKNEPFILSNGHAGIALYAVLIKHKLMTMDDVDKLHIHPDRNKNLSIDVSTGSLGQGLPIAVGMALADRKKNVYCLISDGETAEGSIWEALRITEELRLNNLKIVVNVNGWGAYSRVSSSKLIHRLKGFSLKVIIVNGHSIPQIKASLQKKSIKKINTIVAKTKIEQLPFLKGQDAHYYVMTENDYNLAKKILHETT